MVTLQTSNDLDGASIHIWRIDLDGPIGDLSAPLSADESARATAKKLSRDRHRFILAHGAKRTILGGYLGIPGEELLIVAGDRGKPYLHHPDSDLQFNLTHCEGMALLAVAAGHPVGIDLEQVRDRPSQAKIARRMFPDSIYREMVQLPSEQFGVQFYRYWTELEARSKCIGAGIFSNDQDTGGITTRHFDPQDGWIACVAIKDAYLTSMELKHFLYMK